MQELGRVAAAEALAKPAHTILIILDDVRSMHNVGSVFRSADAFGIAGIWLCGYTPTPPHRDIHKTALGATDSVPWRHLADAATAVQEAINNGYQVFAVEQAVGSQSLAHYTWTHDRVALVFGNEVTGISDEALACVQGCLEIPQFGAKHSLNISVTVGVVLWEMVRQQLKSSPGAEKRAADPYQGAPGT